MDDLYVKRWLKKIQECRTLTERRNGRTNHTNLSWELRKLNEMETRLKKDKYMYWSYQAMLRDWLLPSPNFDPYYRKKIDPRLLERSEPKGKNNASATLDVMLEITGEIYRGRNEDENIQMAMGICEELIQEADTASPDNYI